MTNISIRLNINDKLFLRDPQSSELGQRIVQNSILLIDELGFEEFNFRKLAERINSTEGSIYRYFENKHYLLLYLLNWYWEWMKFRIDYNTMNIIDPVRRLRICIEMIVDATKRNASIDFVDEDILHKIVVAEGPKGYHTKTVDEKNKEGFFLSYKSLTQKIADIFLEINPAFDYPRALASTLLETANNTIYFAQHLPKLTDITHDSPDFQENIQKMLRNLVYGALQKKDAQQRVLPMQNGTQKIAAKK
ncbi:MAG: TetR/AcrR family transcriptional regulator [Saprospiraceae bacterium]